MKGDLDGDRAESNTYFKKIADEENEELLQYLEKEEERNMAKLLYKISGYIGAIDNDKSNKYKKTTSDDGSYENLYHDIEEIITGDLNAKVGRFSYQIKIYQQVAYWLYTKHERFASVGITQNQMNDMLVTIERNLRDLNVSQDSNDFEDYQDAMSTVQDAKKIIESYFSNRNKGGGN